jgi:hypothetical protein
MQESHVIFEQVFATVSGDKETQVPSVFQEVARLILMSHDKKTGESLLPANGCQNINYRFVQRDNIKIFRQTDCRTQPSIKRDLLQIIDIGNNKFVWNFETAYLTKGAGLALSLYGQDIRCEVELDKEGLLLRQRCKGLGQNYNRNEYLVFTDYQFLRGQQSVMVVKGEKFFATGRRRSTFDMPIPLTGVINYFERVESLNDENETVPATLAAPDAAASEESLPLPPPPAAPQAVPQTPSASEIAHPEYGLETHNASPKVNPAALPEATLPTQLPDHQVAGDLFPQCDVEQKQILLKMTMQPKDVDENCQFLDPKNEELANSLPTE